MIGHDFDTPKGFAGIGEAPEPHRRLTGPWHRHLREGGGGRPDFYFWYFDQENFRTLFDANTQRESLWSPSGFRTNMFGLLSEVNPAGQQYMRGGKIISFQFAAANFPGDRGLHVPSFLVLPQTRYFWGGGGEVKALPAGAFMAEMQAYKLYRELLLGLAGASPNSKHPSPGIISLPEKGKGGDKW